MVNIEILPQSRRGSWSIVPLTIQHNTTTRGPVDCIYQALLCSSAFTTLELVGGASLVTRLSKCLHVVFRINRCTPPLISGMNVVHRCTEEIVTRASTLENEITSSTRTPAQCRASSHSLSTSTQTRCMDIAQQYGRYARPHWWACGCVCVCVCACVCVCVCVGMCVSGVCLCVSFRVCGDSHLNHLTHIPVGWCTSVTYPTDSGTVICQSLLFARD